MDSISAGNGKCGAVQVTQNARIGLNPVPIPDATAVPTVNALQLLDVNRDREELILQNAGTTVIYIGLGFSPSATQYSVALLPCAVAHDATGGIFITDAWLGTVFAISGGPGGLLAVTEEV